MNTCQKIAYQSEQAAYAGLSHLLANSRESAERKAKLAVYQCNACDGWHVGHKAKCDEVNADA